MRRVRQQHENGCVPACIAMIADLSYAAAIRLWYSNHNWNTKGTTTAATVRVLEKLGKSVKVIDFISPFKLKSNAILIVEHDAYGPPEEQAHAVVWDYKQQKVLDPYPDKRRKLHRHLPLSSYEKSLVEIIIVK